MKGENKMKKSISVILATLLAVIAISGCAFAAPKYNIRISACNSLTHPQTLGLFVMKQYVESRTKGDVSVKVFPNSQLGSEEESLSQVQNGSLEMATASIGPLTTFQKKFFVLDIPFLFNTYDEAWMTLDSKVGRDLLDTLEASGFKGLCYMENGFRNVTSSVKAINTIKDFKGLKIRTMVAPMHMANFKALGANPTPVPWSELYLSMQQKIVDGEENPIANMWDLNMYEVQKYVSLTHHIYDSMPLVANLKWFNKLPKEYQEIIAVGAILGQNYSRFVNEGREGAILAKLTQKGMKINTPAPAALAEIKKTSQPTVINAVKKEVGTAYVDKFLNDINTVKADTLKGIK